jgi:hypothetical protein
VVGGAVFHTNSTLDIDHGSILRNRADTGGAAIQSEASTLLMTNSIVWINEPSDGALARTAGQATVTYCDVQLGCTVDSGCTDNDEGNFDADPVIVNTYDLGEDSPCIDVAGGTSPELDIDGNPRVDIPGIGNEGTGFSDIGASEYQLPED